jgi:hypothetical protein
MNKIEKLNKSEEIKLKEYYNKYLQQGHSTAVLDPIQVEKSIEDIYSLISKPKPKIIYCQSPWQMVYMIQAFKNLGKLDLSQLWGQLGNQLRDQLWGQLRDQLGSQLGNQLENQLENPLGNQLRDQLWGQLGNQLKTQLWRQLRNQLVNQLGEQLRNQLWNQLGGQLRDQLVNQLENPLENQLWRQLRNQLVNQLGNQQEVNKEYSYWNFHSSWYLYWLSFYDFPRELSGFKYDAKSNRELDIWIKLSKSVGGFAPYDGICFVCERHQILTLDERGRFHNETGPALKFSDGYSLYSWHGIRLNQEVVENPISLEQIEKEDNAEVRRFMITRYGQAKYLLDSKAEKIHEDDFGVLYKKEIANDEPLMMVKVVNSTPEPDGSYKDYFIRVAPDLKPIRDGKIIGKAQKLTAKAAVASTFGFTEAEYDLVVET